MAQATQVRVGVVHWIDHFVCCVNDVERWYKFNEQLLGAKSSFNDFVWKSGIGIFQDVARTRIGGFLNKDPMPPTRGVGKGLPRYGYYIEQKDVDAHLKRLEAMDVPHGRRRASRTSASRASRSSGKTRKATRWSSGHPTCSPPER